MCESEKPMPIQSVPITAVYPELIQHSWTRHKSSLTTSSSFASCLTGCLVGWLSQCFLAKVCSSNCGAEADKSRATGIHLCYSISTKATSAFFHVSIRILSCQCVSQNALYMFNSKNRMYPTEKLNIFTDVWAKSLLLVFCCNWISFSGTD